MEKKTPNIKTTQKYCKSLISKQSFEMWMNFQLSNHHGGTKGRIQERKDFRAQRIRHNMKCQGWNKGSYYSGFSQLNCQCIHFKSRDPLHCNPSHIPLSPWCCAINDVAVSQGRLKLLCARTQKQKFSDSVWKLPVEVLAQPAVIIYLLNSRIMYFHTLKTMLW